MPTVASGTGNTLRHMLRVLVVAVVVALPLLGAMAPALAADDVVQSMDVTYEVTPDGTVQVRQELDWEFGSTDSHGILLGITTRESWDGDLPPGDDYAYGADAVYQLSNIRVESPTGAATEFTTEEVGTSPAQLDLRIGDPDRTVGTREHTYVVSYELDGALRTFDGTPQLFWDVTSANTPTIKEYTVRIDAPGGVARARCLVGPEECEARVEDGRAVLTGSNARSGHTLTAVAELDAAAISDAEPHLAPAVRDYDALVDVDSHVTVAKDGTARVEQDYTVLRATGSDDELRLQWHLPARTPWSDEQDMVMEVANVTARVGGQSVPVEMEHETSRNSWETYLLRVKASEGDLGTASTVPLSLSYDVRGAVGVEGETASLRWPILGNTMARVADPWTATWSLPGPVAEARCVEPANEFGDGGPCLHADEAVLGTSGTTVSYTHSVDAGLHETETMYVDFPASALVGAPDMLEPSRNLATRRQNVLAIGGGLVGSVLAAIGGALAVRLATPRDQHYLGLAPGMGPARGAQAPVGPVPRGYATPARTGLLARLRPGSRPAVRFTPPDAPLEVAGTLWTRGYDPVVFAAVVIEHAVDHVLSLTSRPPTVWRGPNPAEGDRLGERLHEAAPAHRPDRRDERRRAWASLRGVIHSRSRTIAVDERLFVRSGSGIGRGTLVRWGLIGLVVVVGGALVRALDPGLADWRAILVFLVVAAALLAGARRMDRRLRRQPALTAEGTMIREQAAGFREYIATAEADQLRFEAGEDIFSRYLPWAVLFGLEKRWAKVCEEAARMGRISEPDTSYFTDGIRLGALDSVVSDMAKEAREHATVPTTRSSPGSSSSGGSGGSSGFSSSSSGGSGGGGTSMSSW